MRVRISPAPLQMRVRLPRRSLAKGGRRRDSLPQQQKWGIPEGKSWFSKDMSPFLAISKEEVCEETGGSCMAFCLMRNEGKDLFVIQGHITDNDEIVFLRANIATRGEGMPRAFPQQPDIAEAMSEIRAIVPPPEQNQHKEDVPTTS